MSRLLHTGDLPTSRLHTSAKYLPAFPLSRKKMLWLSKITKERANWSPFGYERNILCRPLREETSLTL